MREKIDMKTGKPKLGLRISLCNEDGTLNEDPDMIRLFLDKVEPIDLGLIVIQFFETQLEEQENKVFLDNVIPFKKMSDK